jgi:class 3 adenylate cyclase
VAAAGAPHARADHPEAALGLGRAILAEVDRWRKANDLDLQVRVGLASGAVVGGGVGRRRIVFHLWGDAVNTAARMESSGVPARIHLAASRRELLGADVFEKRQVDVEGLGTTRTCLLTDS